MSIGYPRPDPSDDAEQQFWDYIARGEVRIQRCADCGAFRHPPRSLCAACGSTGVEWAAVSGRGEVWACTTIHPPTLAAFAARTPYGAVVVRLDEGVFMVSNVADREPAEVAIGMRVRIALTEVEPGYQLPLFVADDAS
jgi:uncharacterized OB-fold protein